MCLPACLTLAQRPSEGNVGRSGTRAGQEKGWNRGAGAVDKGSGACGGRNATLGGK